MSVKIFVFERTSREEVVAENEEEARATFQDWDDWILLDVREAPSDEETAAIVRDA